jgi:hypothetical protein
MRDAPADQNVDNAIGIHRQPLFSIGGHARRHVLLDSPVDLVRNLFDENSLSESNSHIPSAQ